MAENMSTKCTKYRKTQKFHISKLSIIRNLIILSNISTLNSHANFHVQECVDIFIRSWRELGNELAKCFADTFVQHKIIPPPVNRRGWALSIPSRRKYQVILRERQSKVQSPVLPQPSKNIEEFSPSLSHAVFAVCMTQ
jgi:hypothetical protein